MVYHASSHHPFQSLFADFRRFSPLKFHIDFFSFKFTQNESNFKMLYLIEFLFNKNFNQYDRQQVSAQTKHIALIFNFCNYKKDITFCVNHHSKFIVIEYAYSILLFFLKICIKKFLNFWIRIKTSGNTC